MGTPPRAERGFTYIGLLAAVAIMGLLLTVVSRVWTTTGQRERETELLWVGNQYRLAIASYYASGNRFPSSLAELVEDQRFPIPKRHLRRLYADPMTARPDWTPVLTPDGQGIMGIASSSNAAPIKRMGFDVTDAAFDKAECYCDWKFVYWPRRVRWGAPSPTPASPGADPANPNPANPGFNPGHISPLTPGGGLPAPGVTAPRTNDVNLSLLTKPTTRYCNHPSTPPA